MKIKSITIENYRSIKDTVVLNVAPINGKQTFMLLGINESGKSNILEAVALLDEERDSDYSKDCHSKNEDNKKDFSKYVVVSESVTQNGVAKEITKIMEKTTENTKSDTDGNDINILDKE